MADHPSQPVRADAAASAAVAQAAVAVRLPEVGERSRLRQLLEREHVLASVLLAPTLLILILFIAYPFALGLWLAVTDKVMGRPGSFIGLENFRVNLNDAIFLRAFRNTFVYTFTATFLKLALGMAAALLLNHHFKFKRIVRAGMLLPWIVPTVLSTLAWQWMFDATFSVFNWVLMNAGIISKRILWLGDGVLAMGCLIAVNVWRGMPFFAITLLAGLQTVNPDLHEAAEIDGANAWQRFWRVTLPLIKPIIKTIPREIEDCARIDGASRFQAMVRISFPLAIPGILSAGIFAFTLSWNEFLYALVFLSSSQQKTIPIGVFSELVRGDVFYWGPLMAGALLGSIPVAVVYSFFVEHYVAALTGAVKG